MLLVNKLPLTLGHDFSGIISEVVAKIKGYRVGDPVFRRVPVTGMFCEYIVGLVE